MKRGHPIRRAGIYSSVSLRMSYSFPSDHGPTSSLLTRPRCPEELWRGVQGLGPPSGGLAAPMDSFSFLVAGVLVLRRGQRLWVKSRLQRFHQGQGCSTGSQRPPPRCRHEDLSLHYLQLEHVVCTGVERGRSQEPRPKGQAQSNSLLSDLGKVASLGPRRMRTRSLPGVRMTEMGHGTCPSE